MKLGQDQSEITKLLDRYKSNINQDLTHKTGSLGYRPKQGCDIFSDRPQNRRNAPTVEQYAFCAFLFIQWSPEQIISKLPISHAIVYQHFYVNNAQGGDRF